MVSSVRRSTHHGDPEDRICGERANDRLTRVSGGWPHRTEHALRRRESSDTSEEEKDAYAARRSRLLNIVEAAPDPGPELAKPARKIEPDRPPATSSQG